MEKHRNTCCVRAHELKPDPKVFAKIPKNECSGFIWSDAAPGERKPASHKIAIDGLMTAVTIRQYAFEWNDSTRSCTLKETGKTLDVVVPNCGGDICSEGI